MVRLGSRSMAIAAVVWCSALIVPAQSTHDLGIGKLLVAKRDARESTFAETVILVVRYTQGGTVGLMLNRRTEVPVSRALDPLKGASGRSDPVFAGGPVELPNVLALLRTNIMPEGAEHVTGKVYLVPTGTLLEKTLAKRPDPADFRVYLGYCGWSPGQLENETSHGFWRVLNGSADIVFDSEPETLWSRLIERAEQRIARAQDHGVDRAPACAANPSIAAIFEISSGSRPCRFAR
jgi:putative transcriptional regulator